MNSQENVEREREAHQLTKSNKWEFLNEDGRTVWRFLNSHGGFTKICSLHCCHLLSCSFPYDSVNLFLELDSHKLPVGLRTCSPPDIRARNLLLLDPIWCFSLVGSTTWYASFCYLPIFDRNLLVFLLKCKWSLPLWIWIFPT